MAQLGPEGGVIEFTIEGEAGGIWTVDLAVGSVEPRGVTDAGKRADVLVRARDRDFMALVEGRMSPQDGILTERLFVTGEATAITRLFSALASLRGAAGA
jgi:putative sterol carrier protein